MTLREAVLDRVTPDADERRRLDDAFEAVADRARDALDREGVDGEVALVGSAARDTWLAGDRDIDVFLLLPPELDRDRFEAIGLDVGTSVFPDGDVAYAEHPYVTGTEAGFDVDLVPCYDVEDTDGVKSAVDRTPFHTAYVRERLGDGAADEVRLLKTFMRGAEVYGSELRNRGFSGYLCELLVLHYGDFGAVVEAAADWRPDVVIRVDAGGEARDAAGPNGDAPRRMDGPLIVIDPTDPDRNVAAVVSRDSVARFVHHCREWQHDPRPALFREPEPPTIDAEALTDRLAERGTELVAVVTERPDVVDDQLYPQLRKTRESLVGELDGRGFEVLRASVLAGERCGVLLECSAARLPVVERHVGPPVAVREHAESFLDTYRDADVTGPFVDDGRYVVERERDHTTVTSFLSSDEFFAIGFGADLEDRFAEDYDVYADDGVAALLDDVEEDVARHFAPEPPRGGPGDGDED